MYFLNLTKSNSHFYENTSKKSFYFQTTSISLIYFFYKLVKFLERKKFIMVDLLCR